MPKDRYRAHLMRIRDKISEKARLAASASFTEHCLPLLSLHSDTVIAGYYPIHSELDLLPLLTELKDTGHIVCLPCITDPALPLIFRKWDKDTHLVPSHFQHILEPNANSEQTTPDIILVPLLGFDNTRHRMGYGMGFYDRTIVALRKHNPQLITIGVGYQCQAIDKLPVDPHDQPLDYICTEGGIL